MHKIIAFAGFARTGKDSAAKAISETHFRFAYADQLKKDLEGFVNYHYSWDVNNLSDEQKKIIRPYLVAHGAGMRAKDKDHWIKQLDGNVSWENLNIRGFDGEHYCISDCRYLNECIDIIENKKGLVIYITRPKFGPANEEEDRSFNEIFNSKYAQDGTIIQVKNDGTLKEFQDKIRKIVYGETHESRS